MRLQAAEILPLPPGKTSNIQRAPLAHSLDVERSMLEVGCFSLVQRNRDEFVQLPPHPNPLPRGGE
jgi:hypothetical protein